MRRLEQHKQAVGSPFVIKVANLSHSYGDRQALSGLSFELFGGRLALLGVNGAGKSTLLRILATALSPSSGEYSFQGRSTASTAGRRQLRSHLGWLPQAFGYEPSARLVTYLRYLAWLKGLPRAEIDAAVESALTAVELGSRGSDRIRTLSGGMLRRLGIAQAILGDPKLLLLDEPTAGLDPVQRADLHQLIRAIPANRSTIVSTHSIEDVEAVAEQVMIIASGYVQWFGSLQDLRDEAGAVALRDFVPALMRTGGPANR
jgi:ABC-2 type transport system ATP-binding protein